MSSARGPVTRARPEGRSRRTATVMAARNCSQAIAARWLAKPTEWRDQARPAREPASGPPPTGECLRPQRVGAAGRIDNKLSAPVRHADGHQAAIVVRVGRIDEWHLDFTNLLEHTEFDLRPRSG